VTDRFSRSIGELRKPWLIWHWIVAPHRPSSVNILHIGEAVFDCLAARDISRYSFFSIWEQQAISSDLTMLPDESRKWTRVETHVDQSVRQFAKVERTSQFSLHYHVRYSHTKRSANSSQSLSRRASPKVVSALCPLLNNVIKSCRTLFFSVFWNTISSTDPVWFMIKVPLRVQLWCDSSSTEDCTTWLNTVIFYPELLTFSAFHWKTSY
jgi:hypothetical protein